MSQLVEQWELAVRNQRGLLGMTLAMLAALPCGATVVWLLADRGIGASPELYCAVRGPFDSCEGPNQLRPSLLTGWFISEIARLRLVRQSAAVAHIRQLLYTQQRLIVQCDMISVALLNEELAE